MLGIISDVNAQAPPLMNYQTVVRNVQGLPVANTLFNFTFSIGDSIMESPPLFIETDTATTNQFGLATIQIGKIGHLDSVNWGGANKYLQVQVVISGSPTDMGTAQLLSVPYALYARSAGNGVVKHFIGEYYGGGIVFWVDSTGQHGLIAATIDQGDSVPWSTTTPTTLAYSDAIGAGKTNSERSIVLGGGTTIAALLCTNYQGGNYGDWYLPAPIELHLMYLNIGPGNALGLGNIGGFTSNCYWSSMEYNSSPNLAYLAEFTTGNYHPNTKYQATSFVTNLPCDVRAVRGF